MSISLIELLEKNKEWARSMEERHPGFFSSLADQQNPNYLWIGCSDSRVPANEIIGLDPGQVFVHRNVGNQVLSSDINCLSCVDYAVKVLKVEHVIVTGHYGCGGIQASMENPGLGLIDNWLGQARDTYLYYEEALKRFSRKEQFDRLVEINVVRQVRNLARTTTVRNAWANGQDLTLHGWVYSLHDGVLRDLDVPIRSYEDIERLYDQSIERILNR